MFTVSFFERRAVGEKGSSRREIFLERRRRMTRWERSIIWKIKNSELAFYGGIS